MVFKGTQTMLGCAFSPPVTYNVYITFMLHSVLGQLFLTFEGRSVKETAPPCFQFDSPFVIWHKLWQQGKHNSTRLNVVPILWCFWSRYIFHAVCLQWTTILFTILPEVSTSKLKCIYRGLFTPFKATKCGGSFLEEADSLKGSALSSEAHVFITPLVHMHIKISLDLWTVHRLAQSIIELTIYLTMTVC